MREVILIGLGNFGDKVIDEVKNTIEERRAQLGNLEKTVQLHTMKFPDSDVFFPNEYAQTLLDYTANTTARSNGIPFSYIFVGNLYEKGTAKYAIDFAYLPAILKRVSTLDYDEVVGFFAFVDNLVAPTKEEHIAISLAKGFFERLERVNQENVYNVPYTTPDGKPIPPIESSTGPFDRNYILASPGDNDTLYSNTLTIFCERIFYELYYLIPQFKERKHEWKGDTTSDKNSDKNFSCFSMVQVARLKETQRYYLKYLLEKRIYDGFLAPQDNIDNEYYIKEFFAMMDMPDEVDNFPIERAVSLFLKEEANSLDGIQKMVASEKNSDDIDYITQTKERLHDYLHGLKPKYDKFVQTQLSSFSKTLKTATEELFKLDRLNGSILLYSKFINALKEKFLKWESSISRVANSEGEFSLDRHFADAQELIDECKSNPLLSICFFKNIRKYLIRYIVSSIPVKEYVRAVVTHDLAKTFLEQWRITCNSDYSPILYCDELVQNLSKLQEKIADKCDYINKKIRFIENMNSFQYVISMCKDNDEYATLLKRIKGRIFGIDTNDRTQANIKAALKRCVDNKDIYSISQDPTSFIEYVDTVFIDTCKDIYTSEKNVEDNKDAFFAYSKNASSETNARTKAISNLSFNVDGDDFLKTYETILMPALDTTDKLEETFKQDFREALSIKIPKDFTIGSVVYFRDYLFMSFANIKKAHFFARYPSPDQAQYQYNASISVQKAPQASDFAPKEEDAAPLQSVVADIPPYDTGEKQDAVWKMTRSILMFYVPESKSLELFNATFKKDAVALDDEQYNALSTATTFEVALDLLSLDKLNDFAKDFSVPVKSDKQAQIKLILHDLSTG